MSGEVRKEDGFEARDAHPGSTLRAGIFLLAAMFLVAAVVVPLYRLLARQEAQEQSRPATLIKTAPSALAVPRLVSNEPAALATFRAKEDANLEGYGWVEKDRGIARMPIAEALRIVGERGALPEFPVASPSPGAAAGDATSGGTR